MTAPATQFPTHGKRPARSAHIFVQPRAGRGILPRFAGLRNGDLMRRHTRPTPLLPVHAVLIGTLLLIPLVVLMAITF